MIEHGHDSRRSYQDKQTMSVPRLSDRVRRELTYFGAIPRENGPSRAIATGPGSLMC